MRKFVLAAVLGVVLSFGLGAVPRPANTGVGAKAALKSATKPANTRPAGVKATLDSAKKLYWKGRYAEAAKAYGNLLDRPADAVAASIGLAEAHAAVGKYKEAIAALRASSARAGKNAEWHVLMSNLLSETGKYEEALAAARKAFAVRDDWAPTVLRLGEALEILGRKTDAIKTYKALEKAIARDDFTTDARSLVAAGMVLDRYAILSGMKASEQAQNILHNYLQEAYRKADKNYWPANVTAGMFLLSKYKPRQAVEEFKLAEKINKRIPAVFVGRGIIHLQRWQFEQVVAETEKALKINPNCADAHLLKAATLLRWRKFDQVGPVIEKILKVNPNNIDALSLMAALQFRTYKPDKAKPFIERVEKINPKCAELYETIAQWLSAARQFDQAEKYFKKAMKMAPELAGPVTGLGRLYMQTGREKLAAETLNKAAELDDYRQDVINYVNLLKKLKDFQVKETEHFIIKVDGKQDAVLLDLLAEEAERIHGEICKDFNHVPAEKTLVEMFPTHKDFSVRISGKGWIQTVGACTGRVIGMPAPDPIRSGMMGPFNWAVVLRHEYTHTVTLAATKNRIPHWFTEACAVWEQPDRRNYQAVGLLVKAVRNKKLYPVKSLSWGFIRPGSMKRGRGARTLAYAQSEWIFEYVVEKKGYDAIIKMLDGFRDGWTQTKVFAEVLGTTEGKFDKDFRVWAIKQIASWGFDAGTRPTMRTAPKAAKANPKSADAQANLAYALIMRRRYRQAEAPARRALKIDPKHPRALAVLGSVLVNKKKYEEAVAIARRLEEVKPRSSTAARIIADSRLAKHRWPEAIAALETYKQRRPLDPYGYKKLAKLYMQLGQSKKAIPNLIELHRRTMRDPKYARQIADIYRTSATPEKALHYYKEVIHINPYDAGAYKAMAGLHLGKNQYDQAVSAMRGACLLEPKNADVWTQLAMVYYRVARSTKSPEKLSEARTAAQKAIELDPESQATEILQMINEDSNR